MIRSGGTYENGLYDMLEMGSSIMKLGSFVFANTGIKVVHNDRKGYRQEIFNPDDLKLK
jgi:hypothetical protein